MTVTNGDATDVAVHAEVMEWTQVNGRDVYTPTRDVLVNPAIFQLKAQDAQILRLGLQVPANAVERAYRIFVQELPRAQTSAGPGTGVHMQTVLRLAVPVFVPSSEPRIEARWHLKRQEGSPADARALVLENAGSTHIQITRLALRGATDDALLNAPMSFYVLAGQSAAVPVRLPRLEPGMPVTLVEAVADTPRPLPTSLLHAPRADRDAR